ncbi:MAG: hypothetical protein AB8I08_16180 [Sandaracinaceae bacterium]
MKPKKLFHAVVVVGATLVGGCGDDRTTDAGAVVDAGTDAAVAIADAAMDAATEPDDAGMEEDAMVLIL